MNDNRAGALPPHRAESRLIKAASDAVRNHCAKPDRTDCPDSEAIHAVVVRQVAYPGFDDTVDHIAMCAPCLDEYNGRRRDYRVRRRASMGSGLCGGASSRLFLHVYRNAEEQSKRSGCSETTSASRCLR